MKYSICSTVYNAAPRLRASLDSILQYINPEEFEIVVVDSKSKDGTLEILKEYANKFPNFKIIVRKCTRGKGRQIAFENSQGEYIIPVDLDTIYLPPWWELIKAYESWEGKDKYALQAIYSGIYPRHLLEKVGGWRDLQYAEDFDLWWRLIEIDSLKIYPLVTGKNWKIKERESIHIKNILHIVYRKYLDERDRFIVRSEFNLGARLREIKMWSKRYSYYLFWIPLTSLARVAALLKNVERRDADYVRNKWFNNFINMNIKGDIIYSFVAFPQFTTAKGLIKFMDSKWGYGDE
ncbi:glycosyltransferase family 2 protein [Candidatus Aciduliprofundum boonei]|uniref:Glycosyl transferase family 2 n=1 Tax=Aciduliprofundum boonei (strain DSM 19572 / T469) TaxID=439481 RepID=B5IDL1_ACIB4|nr:glycosyltransferase family 2 protein [Candidatus Aciduliprofundum boonei]ADD08085.1 glycosyl transferase family 2 [Aciduliprofundum boonei T469]EDY35560.1 glycosyl transferase, group 2 family protein [Aciduliprofundum boonei T469]